MADDEYQLTILSESLRDRLPLAGNLSKTKEAIGSYLVSGLSRGYVMEVLIERITVYPTPASSVLTAARLSRRDNRALIAWLKELQSSEYPFVLTEAFSLPRSAQMKERDEGARLAEPEVRAARLSGVMLKVTLTACFAVVLLAVLWHHHLLFPPRRTIGEFPREYGRRINAWFLGIVFLMGGIYAMIWGRNRGWEVDAHVSRLVYAVVGIICMIFGLLLLTMY